MTRVTEAVIEQTTLERLENLGYENARIREVEKHRAIDREMIYE